MKAMDATGTPNSRWTREFEKQISRRKHVLLYGDIHDYHMRAGQYVSVLDFVFGFLRDKGYEIVFRLDPLDGFAFADEAAGGPAPAAPLLPDGMRQRFEALARKALPIMAAPPSPEIPAPTPTNPCQPPSRQLPTPARAGGAAQRPDLENALGQVRHVSRQSETPAAGVVDLADMLTADAGRYGTEERPSLLLLKKATLEASVLSCGRLAGYRNTLVLLASGLPRVPEWLYRDNPHIALVQVMSPDKEERRQFALSFLRPSAVNRGFFGGDQLDPTPVDSGGTSSLGTVADEIADLTEGFRAMDLETLRHASWQEKIPLRPREVWRLVDFYKFGEKTDPWQQLDRERVASAGAILSRQVMGQEAAVNAVTTMLTSAQVGVTLTGATGRGGRPKGVFFFVGPTGVGKTELSKALTRLVFSDEGAFERFDMSEYKEEHAAEKLTGAPPGYVGYEEGGRLTNRVLERPHSILLFDEIEKAHPRVLDKFLQILEDGRLTDGKGQTAYFNQAAIVFTSNIGASDTAREDGTLLQEGILTRVRREGYDQFSYARVEAHFKEAVEWHFTHRIGRAELYNRLGDNIVAFDLLRPEYVAAIGQKFLNHLTASAKDQCDLDMRFHPSVLGTLEMRMREEGNLLYGGRRIKTLLESLVERPLNRWIFENRDTIPTHSLEVGLGDDGGLKVYNV